MRKKELSWSVFHRQVPLTIDVENYSNNEKIFYPEKLDCTEVKEGASNISSLSGKLRLLRENKILRKRNCYNEKIVFHFGC